MRSREAARSSAGFAAQVLNLLCELREPYRSTSCQQCNGEICELLWKLALPYYACARAQQRTLQYATCSVWFESRLLSAAERSCYDMQATRAEYKAAKKAAAVCMLSCGAYTGACTAPKDRSWLGLASYVRGI